jgi:hypothetical protein
MNINHNFETIEGKVYKSGVIPPDEIVMLESTTSNLLWTLCRGLMI